MRVDGQLVVNDTALARQAALDGLGTPSSQEFVAPASNGKLVRVLEDL